MANIIASLKVNSDFSSQKAYEASKAALGDMVLAICENPSVPGNVFAILHVENADVFNNMIGNADMQKAAQELGIIGINDFSFAN